MVRQRIGSVVRSTRANARQFRSRNDAAVLGSMEPTMIYVDLISENWWGGVALGVWFGASAAWLIGRAVR